MLQPEFFSFQRDNLMLKFLGLKRIAPLGDYEKVGLRNNLKAKNVFKNDF